MYSYYPYLEFAVLSLASALVTAALAGVVAYVVRPRAGRAG